MSLELPAAELEGGFSRRTVAAIAGVAAVSFAAAVLLTFFGRDLSRPPSPKANTWSRSALGHRAIADLLVSLGLGVVSRETRSALGGGTGPQVPLVLAEPDPDWLRADRTRRLPALADEAQRNSAPLILVLPKWDGQPLSGRPEWIAGLRLLPLAAVRLPLQRLLPGDELSQLAVRRVPAGEALGCSASFAVWRGGPRLRIELAPAQLLAESPGLVPLVSCRAGVLVARRQLRPNGPDLLIVADPDLINNQGIARGDHAALVYRLLALYLQSSGLVFDETIHGFERGNGLVAEVLRFPLVLVLLQAVILLAAVLWAGMGRFGKPLPAATGLAAGMEILIDNTARLLTQGDRGGGKGAPDSLTRYYGQTLRAVAGRLFLPADLPARETRERLQRIAAGRRPPLDLRELERRLADPGEPAPQLARAIHRFRLEMTDGH